VTVADDGFNPNTVAANIITQVDKQFINAGVKFVVAVGDTVDVGSATSIGTRALYAQDLYNAGIVFTPCRNHESCETPPDLTSGQELRHAFPQIGTGVNNNTPSDITTALITATDLANIPGRQNGHHLHRRRQFTEPTQSTPANNSVSYAFRYGNATFMLLDQFDVNGTIHSPFLNSKIGSAPPLLLARRIPTPLFLLTKPAGRQPQRQLLGGNLVPADSTAGKDPGDGNGMDLSKLTSAELITLTAKQAAENNFIASMQANKVDSFFTGHDHHHYVSIVISPDD